MKGGYGGGGEGFKLGKNIRTDAEYRVLLLYLQYDLD